MATPSGEIINTAYFDSVIARIESCGTCEDIQAALNDATSGVSAQTAALTAKLAQLQPYLALLSAPSANPAAIVTWITDFIEAQIKPMIVPTTIIPAQIAALAEMPAKFAQAAETARARLSNCSITVPDFNPAQSSGNGASFAVQGLAGTVAGVEPRSPADSGTSASESNSGES